MLTKEDAHKIVMDKLKSNHNIPFDIAEYVCIDNENHVFLLKSSHPTLTGIPLFYLVDQQGSITSYTGFKYFQLIKKKTSLKRTIKDFFNPYRNLITCCLNFFRNK